METQSKNKISRMSAAITMILLVMRYLSWGLFCVSGLVIVGLNADPVIFNYFWSKVALPLYLLLLLSFIVGWLIGISLNIMSHMKLHAYNRRLQQRCYRLEKEINRLKKDFIPEKGLYSLSEDDSSLL